MMNGRKETELHSHPPDPLPFDEDTSDCRVYVCMYVVDRPDMQSIKRPFMCLECLYKMLVVRALGNKLAQKFNLLIQSK